MSSHLQCLDFWEAMEDFLKDHGTGDLLHVGSEDL